MDNLDKLIKSNFIIMDGGICLRIAAGHYNRSNNYIEWRWMADFITTKTYVDYYLGSMDNEFKTSIATSKDIKMGLCALWVS